MRLNDTNVDFNQIKGLLQRGKKTKIIIFKDF